MAENYSVNLKAQLDTTDVQNKLQQLGNTGENSVIKLETAINNLNGSIQQLGKSWHNVAEQQKQAANNMTKFLRGAGAAIVGQVLQTGGRFASATGHENIATGADFAGSALKGAGMGAAFGSVVPVVGTTVGAAVGAAAGLASKALDNLATSAEKTAKVMEDIAKLETVNAQTFEQEAMRRQIEERVPNMTSSDLVDRRKFLSQDIQEYRDFLMMNQKRLGEAKQWGFNWSGRNGWEIGPAGGKLSEYEREQAQTLLEQTRTLKERADVAQKEIDAINKELELRGVDRDAREDLIEAIKNEKEMLERNAREEAQQKAEFDRRAQIEQRQQDTASGLVSSIEDYIGGQTFSESLKTMSVSDLKNVEKTLTKSKSELQSSALFKASQAKEIGGAEGAKLLAEAQDEFGRSREAGSRLSQVQSVLRSATNMNWLGSMQALYSEAQKGYDVGGYGKLDEQMLKVEQETKDATKNAASSLRSIKTKLDEVKNAISSGNLVGTYG